jgi:hypothetical protein
MSKVTIPHNSTRSSAGAVVMKVVSMLDSYFYQDAIPVVLQASPVDIFTENFTDSESCRGSVC